MLVESTRNKLDLSSFDRELIKEGIRNMEKRFIVVSAHVLKGFAQYEELNAAIDKAAPFVEEDGILRYVLEVKGLIRPVKAKFVPAEELK